VNSFSIAGGILWKEKKAYRIRITSTICLLDNYSNAILLSPLETTSSLRKEDIKMDSILEYLISKVDELEEQNAWLINRLKLAEMRIENLEKKVDDLHSPTS
jgi:hypothetical protein